MYEHSYLRSEQKPMKNVGNSSRGRCQESRKFSGHPFRPYRAHCAVIFAIAQLSCFPGCRLHSFLHGVDASDARLVSTSYTSIENAGKQKQNVCSWLNQNTMLLVHILYAYKLRGRKYRNKMQVYFCNIFKLSALK